MLQDVGDSASHSLTDTALRGAAAAQQTVQMRAAHTAASRASQVHWRIGVDGGVTLQLLRSVGAEVVPHQRLEVLDEGSRRYVAVSQWR